MKRCNFRLDKSNLLIFSGLILKCILGSTYTGHFENVQMMERLLDDYEGSHIHIIQLFSMLQF